MPLVSPAGVTSNYSFQWFGERESNVSRVVVPASHSTGVAVPFKHAAAPPRYSPSLEGGACSLGRTSLPSITTSPPARLCKADWENIPTQDKNPHLFKKRHVFSIPKYEELLLVKGSAASGHQGGKLLLLLFLLVWLFALHQHFEEEIDLQNKFRWGN